MAIAQSDVLARKRPTLRRRENKADLGTLSGGYTFAYDINDAWQWQGGPVIPQKIAAAKMGGVPFTTSSPFKFWPTLMARLSCVNCPRHFKRDAHQNSYKSFSTINDLVRPNIRSRCTVQVGN